MAEAVAMRAAFLRLGFSADAANALTDNQGIDSVDTLKFLARPVFLLPISSRCSTLDC